MDKARSSPEINKFPSNLLHRIHKLMCHMVLLRCFPALFVQWASLQMAPFPLYQIIYE